MPKNPVIAVFAMKQKIKATKELSLFTGLVEMTSECSSHIRPGPNGRPPRYSHIAKP